MKKKRSFYIKAEWEQGEGLSRERSGTRAKWHKGAKRSVIIGNSKQFIEVGRRVHEEERWTWWGVL